VVSLESLRLLVRGTEKLWRGSGDKLPSRLRRRPRDSPIRAFLRGLPDELLNAFFLASIDRNELREP
jgi:hypothetical protein